MTLDAYAVIVAAGFGLIFGSFATAVAYRVPRRESISTGRSKCPHCGATITARREHPVLQLPLPARQVQTLRRADLDPLSADRARDRNPVRSRRGEVRTGTRGLRLRIVLLGARRAQRDRYRDEDCCPTELPAPRSRSAPSVWRSRRRWPRTHRSGASPSSAPRSR